MLRRQGTAVSRTGAANVVGGGHRHADDAAVDVGGRHSIGGGRRGRQGAHSFGVGQVVGGHAVGACTRGCLATRRAAHGAAFAQIHTPGESERRQSSKSSERADSEGTAVVWHGCHNLQAGQPARGQAQLSTHGIWHLRPRPSLLSAHFSPWVQHTSPGTQTPSLAVQTLRPVQEGLCGRRETVRGGN